MKSFISGVVCATVLCAAATFSSPAHAGRTPYCIAGPVDLTDDKAEPLNAASRFDSRVARDWFAMQTYLFTRSKGFTPPVVSRILAYSSAALYETLVPGMPEHRSLIDIFDSLTYVPPRRPDIQYIWSLAANSAMYHMTKHMIAVSDEDDLLEEYFSKVEELYGKYRRMYEGGRIDPRLLRRSEKRGKDVAAAIYAWSMSDGGHEAYENNFPTALGKDERPGAWVPTTLTMNAGLLPDWGENRPFAIKDGAECMPEKHPEYSEDPESAFYKEAKEVYEVSKNLTEEQLAIAHYWADNPSQTPTPPGHTFDILTHILEKEDKRLDFAADAYLKMGLALADAFIGCWHAKYYYNLVRPVTYINDRIEKGWMPKLLTPPFPEYPSGHSTQVGAAGAVFEHLFGTSYSFTDSSHAWRGMAPRSFDSFEAFQQEAAMSRLYGGIHYRAAIDNGITQGECIAQHTIGLPLRIVPQHTSDAGAPADNAPAM